MENVVAYRNFHKVFALCKILQTHAALLLLNHIGNVSRVLLSLLIHGVVFVLYLFHRSVVNADNSFNLSWIFFFLIVKSIEGPLFLLISEALFCEVEADYFEYDDNQEHKNGNRHKSKYGCLDRVLCFQVKLCCTSVFFS